MGAEREPWFSARRRVRELERSLLFWVNRADEFERHLPPNSAYKKARGVLAVEYSLGRELKDAAPVLAKAGVPAGAAYSQAKATE